MPPAKPNYQVNLQKLHACCSGNYLRLFRLIRGMNGDKTLAVTHPQHSLFQLYIVDEAPYTTTLDIEHKGACLPDSMLPSMRVRMYHDAQMAEVLRSQQISNIKPVYHYPNRLMHQRDEKWQVNQFLAEWLQLCLDRGVRTITIC